MSSARLGSLMRAFVLALTCVAFAACSSGGSSATPNVAQNANGLPPIKHVFTIILENQAYNNTFGAQLPVPYLSQTAAAQGALVQNYYGTSHFSLGNYISLVSGQAVTTANQDDCTNFGTYGGTSYGSNYVDINQTALAPYNQVQGIGCVYPAAVTTIADQLMGRGYTWKGYMEDMGNDPTRESASCGQPSKGLGYPDNTSSAQVPPSYNAGGTQRVTDQYAARHNPFVYFHSLLDSGACAQHVVPLVAGTLTSDLQSINTTPNYVFITPNLCNDGHDVPCKSPSSPDSYVAENTFLQTWVPVITHSPAFQKDGLLVIIFDESSPAPAGSGLNYNVFDGTACCNEPSGPNTNLPGVPDIAGLFQISITGSVGNSGGGQTGAVFLSPFIKPGTVSTTAYNHYSLLHTFEDIFGLSYLGYAGLPGTSDFGSDIFGTSPGTKYSIAL